jgi:dihydrofolate reductase
MRKLKLQVQVSADGFVGGPHGELDWMTWNWDDALKKYVNDLTEPVDTILLGKNMTDGFVTHWENVKANPKDEGHAFGTKMIDTPKVVFSRTLDKSHWNNTTLANGDYVEVINKLKNQPGKDIIVYGGATFVSSLIKAGLIDEYNLFINPTAIGKGLAIFNDLGSTLHFNVTNVTPFTCGVVAFRYEPKT